MLLNRVRKHIFLGLLSCSWTNYKLCTQYIFKTNETVSIEKQREKNWKIIGYLFENFPTK